MGDKPKPYLKKGAGKYAKISYPVLRRSGAYQPPPDTAERREERRQHLQPVAAAHPTRSSPARRGRHNTTTSPSSTSSPPRRFHFRSISPPSYPTVVPRLQLGGAAATATAAAHAASVSPQETGVLGARSPSLSSHSSEQDYSPPRVTAFGSSLDSRPFQSDEGRGSSTGFPSSRRPRTAATVDSGYPRDEELPPLSPLSSSGSTRASSIRSMVLDATTVPDRRDMHSPDFASPLPVAAAATGSSLSPTRAASAASAAAAAESRDTPSAPIPALRRSILSADQSVLGNTTAEFERREREIMRRGVSNFSPVSSSTRSSTTSSCTHALVMDAKRVRRGVERERGEEPHLRRQLDESEQAAAAAAAGRVLDGLPKQPLPRMISTRLDQTVASDASIPSPIERVEGGEGRVRGAEESVEDFHRRPDSSSHFRIATSSMEGEEREEREQSGRGRAPSAASDGASSGSTAVARRYLLGDRLPLDEVLARRRRSTEEITMTQMRPTQQTRASQATLRRPAPITPSFDEDDDDVFEPVIDLSLHQRRGEEGRREMGGGRERTEIQRKGERRRGGEIEEQRVRQLEAQLRDAIAHSDMGMAAMREEGRRLKRECEVFVARVNNEFRKREQERGEEWKRKEKEREEEMKGERKRVEELKSQLEKERRLLHKDEGAKVKEWRSKYEEKHAAHAEVLKRLGKEQSTRRVMETKWKKEKEEDAASIASLQKENERMRRIVEGVQREKASLRGVHAHRSALARAENEAATAPRRNGLVRTRYGSGVNGAGGGGWDKENELPGVSQPLQQQQPQGILKNVRFAASAGPSPAHHHDVTFTVQPPDDRFFELDRGHGEWGPCVTYANEIGNRVVNSRPACGCLIFQYANGDYRHILPFENITFHYFATCGSMQLDCPVDQRRQVRFFKNGTLEILRPGKEITRVTPEGERTETIKRVDGRMHAELWQDHTLSVYEAGRERVEGNQYSPGCQVSRRLDDSVVFLHSNKNIEFNERRFILIYHAGSSDVKLVIRATPQNPETQYIFRPACAGSIVHVRTNARGERCKTTCFDFCHGVR